LFIDTHPGVNEETLLSIAISDKLLLVMRPDSQDFQGTAVTAELARRLEIPEMLMVINKVPPGMDTAQLRERVEQTFQAEVAAILPINYEIVRLASAGIFVNRHPDHPMSLGLKQVAQRVMS
jgi:MinD-like ATPase involved in chromosome partitioning or flagellar assembly